MVLEKLGSSLKNTLKKITGALFVDEKLINEMVKDIQRSLLQADVSVKLVLELTKTIKERATKEEPPRNLDKREHLINIVYEELTRFIGGEHEAFTLGKKKPFTIMLVGLFGNGKCIHPDCQLLLNDGTSLAIKELYDHHKKKENAIKLADGEVLELTEELFVPSFNPYTLKTEKKRATHLWKLKNKGLLEVTLDNGKDFSIRTTKEHPFFTLRNGEIEKVRADELKKGQPVAIPSVTHTENETIHLEELKELDLQIKCEEHEIKAIKKELKDKHGSLRKALVENNISRNYPKFTHNLNKGELPIQLYPYTLPKKITVKHTNAHKWVSTPTTLTDDFSEILGYIIGDGCLTKHSITISTQEPEIIERIQKLSHEIFSTKATIIKDKRRKNLVSVRIASQTLAHITKELFNIPIGKKGRNIEIPRQIMKSPRSIITPFIHAYIDCDGYFSPKQRQIEIVSESKKLILQLHHLLLQYGIVGTRINKIINGKEYYRLMLQARNVNTYASEIGSTLKRKEQSLQLQTAMTTKQGDGKQNMIPVGKMLRELRESYGYSINQIQQKVSSYGLYEEKGNISKTQLQKIVKYYEQKQKGNVKQFIELLQNKEIGKLDEETALNRPTINALVGEFKNKHYLAEVTNSPTKLVLTRKGEKFIQKSSHQKVHLLTTLKRLATSDVHWIKVKNITKEKTTSFVYDLTVEDNHSFIANGIIVHNTTSAGKLANYYKKRGYKVAVVQTDTWRPAAYRQLQTLAEQAQVTFYGKEGQKNPVKIYRSFEKDYHDYDLLIVDTAGRDALSEELVRELTSIREAVQADETWLVMGADVGQTAQKQAEQFHTTAGVSGVIITKLDGTAKGGGALSACAITGAPVRFIGTGEKMDELELFNAKGFVGRILGMGDLEALLDKAKAAMTEEEAADLGRKLLKGDFNLLDLYEQMQAMKKMGPLSKVLEMVPGMSSIKMPKEALQVQEGKLEKWRSLMDSMTKAELENPDEVRGERLERISKGSGIPASELRSLLKQYKQSKKMMKMMKGGDEKAMQKMMKRMGPMKF